MAIKLVSSRDAALLHGVKIMAYGKAGVGKTMLCSTLPNPVILSAEAGLLSLRHHNLPVIQIRNIDDLVEANRWAYDSNEAKQFASFGLDSVSEIAETVLNAAKKESKDPRQAYGAMIERMQDVIRSFRDLPGKHVYFSAKQELIKDETSGVTMYGPSMPGAKLAQQLPYFFDEVFHLGIGRTPEGVDYRYLRTRPDLQYDAKDRSGALDAIEKPDLSYIIDKITKGNKA